VDEAEAVLRRLERIDALERDGASPRALLVEVRALLAEAETWARREGRDGEDALSAVASCRAVLPEGREPVRAS
jgi:hypothetical protein